MPDLVMIALFAGGIMGALFLVSMAFYYPRVRRWHRRALSEGEAVCRDCGHTGTLSYGFASGTQVNSTNLRLVCAKCMGENWYVPGGKRDHQQKPAA